MKTTRIVIAALIAAGLASSPFAATAKSHKQSKSHSTMTTGSSMKPSHSGTMGNTPAANPSGQGNVGPGTNNNMGPAPGGK
jgi:hypothetical protein